LNKQDPPTTFGVFKPVGHTLMAFRTARELETAQIKLFELGFPSSSMVYYTASEMLVQVEAQLLTASPLATFGYELDLIRAHGDLAREGCSFLVVEAPTDALAHQVAQLVDAIQPATAQHYGQFMIQDLTEKPLGAMGERVEH
jgi:hypothetical protein